MPGAICITLLLAPTVTGKGEMVPGEHNRFVVRHTSAQEKARSLWSGPTMGNSYRSLCTVLADGERLALEREFAIHRRAGRRAEIRQGDQVLQIVREPVRRVGKGSKVGVVFQWIANFQHSAGSVIAADVYHQRIVGPLAYFMRERGHVLCEGAHVVHISGMGVRLRRARVAG